MGPGARHVPQSISTSAFTVGGTYRDDPTMDRMDRGGMGGVGMSDPMGMGAGPVGRGPGGPGGMGGMDPHHRSSSMPGGGPLHGRSRSASRGLPNRGPGYHSLDRDGYGDREFIPIREPRERSLDRDFGMGSYGGPGGVGPAGALGTGALGPVGPAGAGMYGRRERSLDRRDMLDAPMDDGFYNRDMAGAGMRSDPMLRGDPMLAGGRPRLSPNPAALGVRTGDPMREQYVAELNVTNTELQRDLSNLKKELELTNQKLGSSMHSIKTFWSPELKKERALRKEESAKYSLINDQLKLLNSENQVSLNFALIKYVKMAVKCLLCPSPLIKFP